MERGSNFFLYDHQAKSSSDSNPLQEGNTSTNSEVASNTNNDGARIEERPAAPRNLVMQEEEQSMPIASLMRIMRRILPPHAKVSEEAKLAIQGCVSEFISFITGEANERCQLEHRKIVTAEDVLWAMERLGFEEYLEPLRFYLLRYRHNEVECLGHHGGHVPMRRINANYRMPPPPPPPPPTLASYGSNFTATSSGLYKDGSGASGSGSDQL
ncbi:nuclear transcription factor Y subunit B-4-like [Gastrolobium bilobum]|uniref:nuclear transcription factor Y subunit B-4-like n=1 Tax=Gastrolobium bilobum TaxID=150636 RepID=UPI002AB315C0|nr:nuclear transcription factor Y subunit B-4-like [Gastrolobium bilobum]